MSDEEKRMIKEREQTKIKEEKEKEENEKKAEFERIRLIVNKKGIIRIEKVVPRGEMSYSEEIL